jgi:hypothetical protein
MTRALREASGGLQDAIDELRPLLDEVGGAIFDDAIAAMSAAQNQLVAYERRPELLLEADELARLDRIIGGLTSTAGYWQNYYDHWDGSVEGSIAPALELVQRIRREYALASEDALLDEITLITRPVVAEVESAVAALVYRLGPDPKDWYGLGPRRFEEVLAEIWAGLGWETILTPPVGDGGLDVRAIRSKHGVFLCYLIEAKAYAPDRPVGIDIVRKLYGVVERERATHGILATTSSFTRGALEEARALRYRMSLADVSRIYEWLREYRRRRGR